MTDDPNSTMCVYQVRTSNQWPSYATGTGKSTQTELIFTNGLAGFGCRVHLVTLLALALVTAHLVDADLAACVWVGALVDICYMEEEQKSNETAIDHRDRRDSAN